ncbi:MAG: trehalose-phosphatase [Deltaproteobacteria bacterium]
MSSNQATTYLFEKNNGDVLEHFIDPRTLFAFDLDGTLAPIVSDPGAIGIPDPVRKEIAVLNERVFVAVITGRSRLDALRHLAFAPSYLIGNHGAEGLPGWESRTQEFVRTVSGWQDQLAAFLPDRERRGLSMENKGASLSIHYRHASDINAARGLILRAVNRLSPQPRRISGICIENLIPHNAPDKGVALTLLMQETGCPKAFFAGDDETDEDVFRLGHENIFTVRVGRKTGSLAQFHLQSQREMVRLLRAINGIIGRQQNNVAANPKITSAGHP